MSDRVGHPAGADQQNPAQPSVSSACVGAANVSAPSETPIRCSDERTMQASSITPSCNAPNAPFNYLDSSGAPQRRELDTPRNDSSVSLTRCRREALPRLLLRVGHRHLTRPTGFGQGIEGGQCSTGAR